MKRTVTELIAANTALRRGNPKPEAWVKKYVWTLGDRIVERTDANLKKLYGCGAFGCAFPSHDANWTVKVTADPWEIALCQFIVNVRRKEGANALPGIVAFRDVYRGPDIRVPWQDDPTETGVIVRESVIPMSEADVRAAEKYPKEAGWLLEGIDALEDARDAGARYNRAFLKKVRSKAESDFMDAVAKIDRHLGAVGEAMRQMHDEYGIMLADVHWGNIGRSQKNSPIPRPLDTLVIFDVGASPAKFPKEYEPRNVKRL